MKTSTECHPGTSRPKGIESDRVNTQIGTIGVKHAFISVTQIQTPIACQTQIMNLNCMGIPAGCQKIYISMEPEAGCHLNKNLTVIEEWTTGQTVSVGTILIGH